MKKSGWGDRLPVLMVDDANTDGSGNTGDEEMNTGNEEGSTDDEEGNTDDKNENN